MSTQTTQWSYAVSLANSQSFILQNYKFRISPFPSNVQTSTIFYFMSSPVVSLKWIFWGQQFHAVKSNGLFFFFFFNGCITAYGCSQARNWLQAAAQLWQHQILNPLNWARYRIWVSVVTQAAAFRFLTHCTTAGTPNGHLLIVILINSAQILKILDSFLNFWEFILLLW